MQAELILNLTWLVVTVGLFALTVTHCNRRTGSVWFRIVLVVLLAAVLFPAISMTDDLHTPVVAANDGDRLFSLEQMTLIAVFVAFFLVAAMRLRVVSRLMPQILSAMASDGFLRATCGRAPPTLS